MKSDNEEQIQNLISTDPITQAIIKEVRKGLSGYTAQAKRKILIYAIEKCRDDKLLSVICKNIDDINFLFDKKCLGLTSNKITYLLYAIECGNAAGARAIIETTSTDTNKRSNENDDLSPLEFAVLKQNRDIIKLLTGKRKTSKISSIKPVLNDVLADLKYLEFLITNKAISSDIFSEITTQPNTSFEGAIIKEQAELKRPPRPHDNLVDRERQILKHVATQLYFAFKYHEVKLTELQIMRLTYDGKTNIFIAANEIAYTSKFAELVRADNFRELLTWAYSPTGNTEGKTRSQYYASKIKKRIFGDSPISEADEKTDEIRKIISAKDLVLLTVTYINDKLSEETKTKIEECAAADPDGKIFFLEITGHSKKDRHAEQFLCDVVDHLKSKDSAVPVPTHSCISGKKRPCVCCHARMSVSKIDNFGKYPGRFWKNTIEDQPDSVKAKVLHTLAVEKKTYVTQSKPEEAGEVAVDLTDFDSRSNSEEDEAKIPKL